MWFDAIKDKGTSTSHTNHQVQYIRTRESTISTVICKQHQ